MNAIVPQYELQKEYPIIKTAGSTGGFDYDVGCVSEWFGRALEWHSRGKGFDPPHLHQKKASAISGCFCFLFRTFDNLPCVWYNHATKYKEVGFL